MLIKRWFKDKQWVGWFKNKWEKYNFNEGWWWEWLRNVNEYLVYKIRNKIIDYQKRTKLENIRHVK